MKIGVEVAVNEDEKGLFFLSDEYSIRPTGMSVFRKGEKILVYQNPRNNNIFKVTADHLHYEIWEIKK